VSQHALNGGLDDDAAMKAALAASKTPLGTKRERRGSSSNTTAAGDQNTGGRIRASDDRAGRSSARSDIGRAGRHADLPASRVPVDGAIYGLGSGRFANPFSGFGVLKRPAEARGTHASVQEDRGSPTHVDSSSPAVRADTMMFDDDDADEELPAAVDVRSKSVHEMEATAASAMGSNDLFCTSAVDVVSTAG
jgi:hypothetical protein